MRLHRVPQSGTRLRPAEYLPIAETHAVCIRKLLRQLSQQNTALANSGLMNDAEKLTDVIEHLARRGRYLPAEDAIGLAEQVDQLVCLLEGEVDTLLTF